eukprot:scaffold4212_cov122-Isochrysis_galbana.AAC.20
MPRKRKERRARAQFWRAFGRCSASQPGSAVTVALVTRSYIYTNKMTRGQKGIWHRDGAACRPLRLRVRRSGWGSAPLRGSTASVCHRHRCASGRLAHGSL